MPAVEANGTTLHVEDDGRRDAPALVLSPSMFFDTRMFAAVASAFEDRLRIVRYDHRGQGQSARAPRDELDMDTLSEDAAALIEALDLAPCHFVGNSMGGFVGLRLAARRPELLASLVVLGTSADAEENVEMMEQALATYRADGAEAVADAILWMMLGETTRTDPARAQTLEWVREMLLSRGPEYADAAWQIAHRRPVLDELGAISLPVTAVAGTEDNTYPPAKLRQIADAIAGARYVELERTGHVHALENPDAVNVVLEEHLSRLGVVG